MPAPTLRTSTRGGREVVLRAHRDDDAEVLVRAYADDDVSRWLSGPPLPYTLEHGRGWVAGRAADWERSRDTEWTWMLDLDGAPAGQVALLPRADGALEVAYVLGRWAWGAGAMTAGVRAALGWAFGPDGPRAPVVHWRALVGNWASRRVAWACGFQVEGRVRGLVAHRGEAVDGWVGSVRAGDELRPVVPWLEVPELEVGDLLLRPNAPGDADRLQQACAHPTTQEWLPTLPSPYTREDARAYLDGREEQHAVALGLYWAVASVDDPDRLLGQIGLMGLDHGLSPSGEIGYWVHPDARRHGVATRAVRAVARHGLLDLDEGGLGLRRVLLRVAETNEASLGVARAAGFTQAGRDRDGERLRSGRVVDHLRLDLLADEMDAAYAHPSSLR
ncbi:GNAT family N-acetyltransferase [Angustibacter speluncae]